MIPGRQRCHRGIRIRNCRQTPRRLRRDEAIEVLHGSSPALPFDPDQPLTAILLRPFETPIDPPEQPLAAALRERFRHVKYVQLGPKSNTAAYEAALELASDAPQLLLAIIVRPAAWHDFGLRPEQKAFRPTKSPANERTSCWHRSACRMPCRNYPEAAVRICTYSDVPVSQQALADFICGRREAAGRSVGSLNLRWLKRRHCGR